MSVCKSIRGFTRHHEWLADFFALLSVVLLFATLYLIVSYHAQLIAWIGQEPLLHIPIALGLLVLDLMLMLFFLNIGAVHSDEEEVGCFHTFRGRRAGTGSLGMMFNSWLHHMEHVGRKHR